MRYVLIIVIISDT